MRCPICGGCMEESGWIEPRRSRNTTYGRKYVYRCVKCGYRTIR